MVQIVPAVGDDGVARTNRCEKLGARRKAAAMVTDLEDIGMKIGMAREQDIFRELSGITHKEHAKRSSASAIAFEHCDERVFVDAVDRIIDRRAGVRQKS